MSAFSKQVGGHHYLGLKMQPLEFATLNQYDPSCFAILKYLTRARHDGMAHDLDKAIHFVQLRDELSERHGVRIPAYPTIPMSTYIRENKFDVTLGFALTTLHEYHRHRAFSGALMIAIRILKDHDYGTTS